MKLGLVIGTRPEIIKMSSLMRICEEKKIDYFIVHSNQHYSENMDKVFFDELNLPQPKYNLQVGSGKQGNQTGKILIKMEEVFEKEKPDIVVAQGDTNTVLAASLAASKMNIKLAHLEAGLRSYNRMMPEETNRIITDHISDYLLAPTKKQEEILLSEGIDSKKIHVVGNPVADAVFKNLKIAEDKINILEEFDLESKKYFLITAHRALNVDHEDNLRKLFKMLSEIVDKYDDEFKFIYPMHPRTKKMVEKFNVFVNPKIKIIEPQGYLEFLQLINNARLIMTDSGGIQEEACIMGVPCVTMREDTERPESVDVGANILIWLDLEKAEQAIEYMLNRDNDWINPFGDGTTAEQLIEIFNKDFN